MAQCGKNVPANAGDTSSIPEQDDSLEKKMAIHSSTLVEIKWTEESYNNPWDSKELDMTEQLSNSNKRI